MAGNKEQEGTGMNEFTIPTWLLNDEMRDELKWRYVVLRYHCHLHNGTYQGSGEAFARDFGIGRYAVDSGLAPFIERDLIAVSVTGIMDYARMVDSRVWTVQLLDAGRG